MKKNSFFHLILVLLLILGELFNNVEGISVQAMSSNTHLSTEQSTSQSTEQSTSQSTSQSTEQSTSQSTEQSTSQTLNDQSNNIFDFLYKKLAKIVFDKAFKRSSPNLKDASNTSSEKQQWDNFLTGASKSEKWIEGTPENGHSVKLHAYYVDHHSDTTVIVQHGYNANSMSVKKQAEMFWNQGYNVLLPDARGTGFSEGDYETLGGLESKDMNLWIDAIAPHDSSDPKKVILWGQSMGAATVMLASNLQNVEAIIEDCGFTTLEDELIGIASSYVDEVPGLKNILYGGLSRTVYLLNKDYYQPTFGVSLYYVSPKDAVAKNDKPKLFIHGTDDKFVPFKDLGILFNQAKGFKQMFVVDGAGHCQSYGKDPGKYTQEIKNFLFLSSSSETEYTEKDWMGILSDNLKVSQLSVPGTHDSAALHGILGFGKTQTLTIPEQLDTGIRFLDIRCKYTNGSFAIHHGPVYQQLMFGDVLNQVTSFLQNHPKETIFMRVKQEQSSVSDSTFNDTFLTKYANDPRWKDYFWNNGGDNKQNPKLGDIRGKIVVLYNVAGLNYGLDYAHGMFYIQDNFDDNYSEKIESINKYLNWANSDNTKYGYINYLSSTNVTASDVNSNVASSIENNNYNCVGILPADFPDERLIMDIINVNLSSVIKKETNITATLPKYVVIDPEKKTTLDENGHTPIFKGVWSRPDSNNNNPFGIWIRKQGSENWTWNSQFWSEDYGYGNEYSQMYQNEKILNPYSLSLDTYLLDLKKNGISGSSAYSWDYNSFWQLSPNNIYTIGVYINNGDQEKETAGIPLYIKAPQVKIDTDKENMNKMLENQKITGTGQAGNIVTIKDGDKSWTGTVGNNGIFSIDTKGLNDGDTVEVTQVNKTGEHSVSDPIEITFKLTRITATLPKYVVIDPERKIVLNENGDVPVFQGTWTSIGNNSIFTVIVSNKAGNLWYSSFSDESYDYAIKYSQMYENKMSNNPYSLNLKNWLLDLKQHRPLSTDNDYDSFWQLKPDSTCNISISIESSWLLLKAATCKIPLYIKAPQVKIDTDEESMNKMLKNQKITGTGQAGNIVTIKDGDKSWTGTVGNNGIFSIDTKGLNNGDTVEVTQMNKTGEHSVSDPIKIKFLDTPKWAISVPANLNLNQTGNGFIKFKRFSVSTLSELKYAIGHIEILLANQSLFTNRVITINGTSKNLEPFYGEKFLGMGGTFLYVGVGDQGEHLNINKFNSPTKELMADPSVLKNIQIQLSSSPLFREICFAIANNPYTVDLSKNYSDLITWNATISNY